MERQQELQAKEPITQTSDELPSKASRPSEPTSPPSPESATYPGLGRPAARAPIWMDVSGAPAPPGDRDRTAHLTSAAASSPAEGLNRRDSGAQSCRRVHRAGPVSALLRV